MTAHRINIAIDGYSSCGKSTLAKELARELGYIYVDSGAMYRAVTLHALHSGYYKEGSLNAPALEADLPQLEIDFERKGGVLHTFLNGRDVEREIRTLEVSNAVSPVSALPAVRRFLHIQQQRLTRKKGVVMDGRDIGTAVIPHAELKIFMTADPEVRAMRRYSELIGKGQRVALQEVRDNLRLRDELDTTRAENPLVRAEDARLLDNTDLNPAEQLELALGWAREANKKVIQASERQA